MLWTKLGIAGALAVHAQSKAVDETKPKNKGLPEGSPCCFQAAERTDRNGCYAVSPYTVTVISTTTSVCSCTDTVVSPTVLIGPLGRRTCDLATS